MSLHANPTEMESAGQDLSRALPVDDRQLGSKWNRTTCHAPCLPHRIQSPQRVSSSPQPQRCSFSWQHRILNVPLFNRDQNQAKKKKNVWIHWQVYGSSIITGRDAVQNSTMCTARVPPTRSDGGCSTGVGSCCHTTLRVFPPSQLDYGEVRWLLPAELSNFVACQKHPLLLFFLISMPWDPSPELLTYGEQPGPYECF